MCKSIKILNEHSEKTNNGNTKTSKKWKQWWNNYITMLIVNLNIRKSSSQSGSEIIISPAKKLFSFSPKERSLFM